MSQTEGTLKPRAICQAARLPPVTTSSIIKKPVSRNGSLFLSKQAFQNGVTDFRPQPSLQASL